MLAHGCAILSRIGRSVTPWTLWLKHLKGLFAPSLRDNRSERRMVDRLAGKTELQVVGWVNPDVPSPPCADCGRRTTGFCDGVPLGGDDSPLRIACLAAERFPQEQWGEGQRTPFCRICDEKHKMCHRCRGVLWCRPPTWQ